VETAAPPRNRQSRAGRSIRGQLLPRTKSGSHSALTRCRPGASGQARRRAVAPGADRLRDMTGAGALCACADARMRHHGAPVLCVPGPGIWLIAGVTESPGPASTARLCRSPWEAFARAALELAVDELLPAGRFARFRRFELGLSAIEECVELVGMQLSRRLVHEIEGPRSLLLPTLRGPARGRWCERGAHRARSPRRPMAAAGAGARCRARGRSSTQHAGSRYSPTSRSRSTFNGTSAPGTTYEPLSASAMPAHCSQSARPLRPPGRRPPGSRSAPPRSLASMTRARVLRRHRRLRGQARPGLLLGVQRGNRQARHRARTARPAAATADGLLGPDWPGRLLQARRGTRGQGEHRHVGRRGDYRVRREDRRGQARRRLLPPSTAQLNAHTGVSRSISWLSQCTTRGTRRLMACRPTSRDADLAETWSYSLGSSAIASIEMSRPWGKRTWAGAERAGAGSGMWRA
jgi:hypothetical protein